MEHKQMTIASIIKKYDEVNNSQYKPNGQALYRFLLKKGLTPKKMYFNGNAVSTFDGRNAVNMMTRFIGELKAIDDEINGRVETKQQEELTKKKNKPTSPELELDGVKMFNENMMNRGQIKLTESSLRKMIKEAIDNVVNSETEAPNFMDFYGDEIETCCEKLKMAALGGNADEAKYYAKKIVECAESIENYVASNMSYGM